MFLQGNFRECPLADLLAILGARGETGRLDVNLGSSTAQLYLVEGKPVDCCFGYVKGEDALELLMCSTEGSFRFASGIAPPNIMFRKEGLKTVESLSEVPGQVLLSQEQAESTETTVADSVGRFRSTTIVLVLATIAGAVGLTIGSVIANIQHKPNAESHAASPAAMTMGSVPPSRSTQSISSPATKPAKQSLTELPPIAVPRKQSEVNRNSEHPDSSKTEKNNANVLSIPVVVRIEDGRVVEAYPAQPQPGHDAYEATAVRLARQKRFNVEAGTQTIYLTITKQ